MRRSLSRQCFSSRSGTRPGRQPSVRSPELQVLPDHRGKIQAVDVPCRVDEPGCRVQKDRVSETMRDEADDTSPCVEYVGDPPLEVRVEPHVVLE